MKTLEQNRKIYLRQKRLKSAMTTIIPSKNSSKSPVRNIKIARAKSALASSRPSSVNQK